MLRSDALLRRAPGEETTADSISNYNSININVLSQIEKELDPYDLVSVVFLLYDAPGVALERLTIFQNVSSDGEVDMNLLYDWAQKAQSRSTWKQEFLEALAICQLYNVVRNLGFQVSAVKRHYLPDNIHVNVHINLMKKALYKLCENITSDNLLKLKNTLKTYDIDTTEYRYCELVLLELVCKKFIIVDIDNLNDKFEIGKLVKIIDNIGGLRKFAADLRELQGKLNNEPTVEQPSSMFATTFDEPKVQIDNDDDNDKFTASAFEDLYKFISQQNEMDVKNIKSDTKNLIEGAYPIKNPDRVGVCYIINQETFHPSKESIEQNISSTLLETRHGSRMDKAVLTETMEKLNFEVINSPNLRHKEMMDNIKSVVQYRVQPDHSIFMLCILSHGVKGHVYAADSVLVKVEFIQNELDKYFQERKMNHMPKVMILQACQMNMEEEVPRPTLVADSPTNYYMRKSHFLIYWATAPELEAYRNETKGSIFIQVLCLMIQKFAKREHLYDIFTKVTDGVAQICTKLQRDQVPIFESTLRKKLFLKMPKQ